MVQAGSVALAARSLRRREEHTGCHDLMKFAWRKWRGISGAVSTPRLQPGCSAAVSALHGGDVLQQGAPLREVVARVELEAAHLEGEG